MYYPFPKCKHRSGFTLLELLAVIALIGVLVSLVVAVSGRGRQAANNLICQSNMRQVGAAMLIYAQDNEGRLPGPLYGQQSSAVNSVKGRLGVYLSPYMESTISSADGVTHYPLLLCPGYAEARPDQVNKPSSVIYRMHVFTWTKDYRGDRLFGVVDSTTARPQVVSTIPNPERVWLMADTDAKDDASWDNRAAQPVHGSTRNRVYLDGHVQAVPLDAPL